MNGDWRPNLLRVILGTDNEVIACNLDDWSPEGFPLLTEKLFAMGVLDVVLKPIQMKKGRPGFQLEVICRKHPAPGGRCWPCPFII